MDNNRRTLTFLLLALALLFGALVRILPVAQAGFPLNDGGLFYSMTSDLLQAHYSLPQVTSYNGLGIPYAYPPLPFYLAALLRSLTGASLLSIIRWLPLVFSILSIPAFFLLAGALLDDSITAALATLIYALLPRSYEWVIMGGGLTRAPAALFLILMTWGSYRLFRFGGWKMHALTMVSAALVILTHPERTLHAAAAALLLFLYFGRSKTGLRRALIVAAGVVLLTAPWWLTALLRYGMAPFAQAFQSGGQRWLFWSPLLLLNFTDETIALSALLAILGVAACLLKKKTFLPVWFGLTFLVDPRSAPHVIAVQTALLAAIALVWVIFPALARLRRSDSVPPEEDGLFLATRTGKWVLGWLLLMLTVNAILNIQQLSSYVLSTADRRAIQWVEQSTPPGSRFLALADAPNAMLSPILEWFPALSGRTNISTVQGREWLPGSQNFQPRLAAYDSLHACLHQEAACLEEWAASQADSFDYVYLSLQGSPHSAPRQSLLSVSLLASPTYQLVYQTDSVLIFHHR